MKAVVIREFGGPDVLRVEDVAEPTAGVREVIVEVKAAGVNPVDTYQRSGAQGYSPQLPFTPGIDAAGVVHTVGSEVTEFSPGDLVWIGGSIGGTYAQQCRCSVDQVHQLPSELSFQEGACLFVNYVTAHRALFQRGSAHPGDTVLIHGATGGVGIAAVQLARHAGLCVIGSFGSPHGEKLLAQQSVELRVDHSSTDHGDRVMQMTNGRGVDLIIENLANVNLALDTTILAPEGRIAVVGSRGSVEISPRELMRREADVRGVMLLRASQSDLTESYAAITAAARAGSVKPVIQESLPLAQAAAAHERVISAPSAGKIVLVP